MKVSLLQIVASCVCFHLATSQDYRLPETVIPSRYVVDIFMPDGVFTGQDKTFEGEVMIHFRVNTSTSEIKLHHRVNITETILNSNGVTAVRISGTDYNSTTEIYTLTLPQPLSVATDYELNIRYTGTLDSDTMHGVYISTYKNRRSETDYLVTTQFESNHARHGFPCFDEPQYKASFALSLTYPTGLTAISNTGVDNSTSVESNYTKCYFKETPVMSTYLVAFIVSAFTCSEKDTIDIGVPHRVCSRDEEEVDRTWALGIGPPLMRTLESITGLKYGNYIDKMDQIAIPDFSAGAMENWGAVTYRETGLLFSEEDTSNIYKKNIALVIAHEFTHMWFGNLVTCKWWDYTFLNEGFARFYQYFAAAATKQFVDWELEKHFNVEQLHTALLADSSLSAQALTSVSESPSEVSNKFGTISYNKGASIYRMIETNIMGAGNFTYGIRDYLSTYQFRGAVPANLWSSLGKFVPVNALPPDVDLSTVLHNWVELAGHPVVKARRSGNDVILTQERFLLSKNEPTHYYVPITYTVSSDTTKFSNTTVKDWLIPGESLTLYNVLNGSDWIVFNNRQSGFYRVDYDDSLWNALKAQLHSNHLTIDVLNRAQIVSDAYNFARSGRNDGYGNWSYADLMDVLSYLEYEQDYYPWYAAIVGNNYLLQRIGYDSEEGQQFISWMLKLMQNIYNTVPFDIIDSSNQVYTMKQIMILIRACKYGESTCTSRSKELFANYRDSGVKVPKNLRNIVYCNALRYSEDIKTDFNFLWQKYGETKLSSEIITILSGLGCAEDVELLKWYLAQTINATAGIRSQDFASVWSYVYNSGRTGTDAALEYIAENYEQLINTYGGVSALIYNIADHIYHEDQLLKLEALANTTTLTESHNSTVQRALLDARSHIELAETLKHDIRSYFIENNVKPETGGSRIFRSSLILLSISILQKLII